jgi:hypothetical protein
MKFSLENWRSFDQDNAETTLSPEKFKASKNFLRFTQFNRVKEWPAIQVSNVPSLIANSKNSA